jgi:hypothetical protein
MRLGGQRFVGAIDSAAASPGFSRKGSTIAGTKHLATGSNLMAWNSRQQCVNHLETAFAIHIGAYSMPERAVADKAKRTVRAALLPEHLLRDLN